MKTNRQRHEEEPNTYRLTEVTVGKFALCHVGGGPYVHVKDKADAEQVCKERGWIMKKAPRN